MTPKSLFGVCVSHSMASIRLQSYLNTMYLDVMIQLYFEWVYVLFGLLWSTQDKDAIMVYVHWMDKEQLAFVHQTIRNTTSKQLHLDR